MSTAVLGLDTRPVGRGRPGVHSTLTRGSALGLGVAMIWFSLLVLIPLAAIVVTAGKDGWQGYVDTLKNPQTWAAIKLTVGQSALVTLLNVVMGTLIAWVLVRDKFWGRGILDVLIDIPFAMPTIVAGLVLLGLYGPKSPLGINVANQRTSVTLALAFVTLPSLVPAIAAGAALSFARAISEYGSLVLLSGMLPYKTEVVSVRVYSFVEGGDQTSAAALATLMLGVALFVIVALDIIQRRVARRG